MCDEKDKQIEWFLKLGNISTNNIKKETINSKDVSINNVDYQKDIEQLSDYGITVSNVTAKWTSNQSDNSLENINLNVTPGRLVIIIGPVGAGKVYNIITFIDYSNRS